jgi:hypothetical protein
MAERRCAHHPLLQPQLDLFVDVVVNAVPALHVTDVQREQGVTYMLLLWIAPSNVAARSSIVLLTSVSLWMFIRYLQK